jgi:hypothetical protein
VTERIAPAVVGLPTAIDLAPEAMEEIVKTVRGAVR